MHMIRTGAAILAAFALAAPALADTITCESDGRERYCAANTRGGVYLSNQLSRNGCYQGDTWGYDGNGIWVSGGCRAEFQTGYSGNNWHGDNDYYSGQDRSKNNDGAAAAVAIGAILGAALIASAASNKKQQSGSTDYQSNWNNGCNAARQDKSRSMSRDYSRHGSSFNSRSEQAYSSGYSSCWSGR
ncbi:DUF3011 domain-containing protein [Sandaracinobacteroides hominis]|uniref:DUF3011 domain-containing protein n=1 Tax=Sandaracinobacteroides hominis TaxID=2780086 RepID=UPI0018F57A6A|nr:DUF3011 domain-containing protein [Sandaracinobacteroides hominis]